MKIDQQTTHSRVTHIRLDSKELIDLIVRAVAAKMDQPVRFNPDSGNVTAVVRFEDETEGSPAYTVGTKAIVSVTEDLLPQVDGDQ